MPRITVEVQFQVEETKSYSGEIEVDVPQSVLNNDGLYDHIRDKFDNDHEFAAKLKAEMDEGLEGEKSEWDVIERVDGED